MYQNDQANHHSGFSPVDAILYSNCQEDLACLLFIMLYHQVSCLDYYHANPSSSRTTKFDISSNLKKFVQIPFSTNELNTQQQSQQFELKNLKDQQFKVYGLHYKLVNLCDKLDNSKQEKLNNFSVKSQTSGLINLREALDDKIRICWNSNWHGGSLIKLCHDLLHNEMLVQNEANST